LDDALDDTPTPRQKLAARRALYTVLEFWIACPTKRCRRWKICAGDPDRCRALFWPVVPQDVKAWWRAAIAARGKGCTTRKAERLADAAAARCRSIAALQGREQTRV
jgi:hypothetical protein